MSSARVLAAGMSVLLAACATPQRDFSDHLASDSPPVRLCAQWYRELDAQVDAAGVRDAQYTLVGGFPYLRVDRFHAALRPRAEASERALHAFVERLLELEGESRRHEIDNLPPEALAALPGALQEARPRAAVLRQTLECARLLRERDLASPQARTAMLERAHVPDDYSMANRILGLYPLTRIAFSAGIRRWQETVAQEFERELEPRSEALVVRYAPPPSPPLPRSRVEALLARAHLDTLGVPSLSPGELERLAINYAPSFEVAIAGDHDRFGELRWRRGRMVPEVNPAENVVYVHSAYTRYGDQVLLQLVYSLWFAERPAQGAVDLLAGTLDGVVWRVTLAPDGEPLVYDAMHACGCYHMFFPTPRAQAKPAPAESEEWAFAPQRLPRVAEDERPVVKLASGTHYIQRIALVRGAGDSLARYAVRPYDELRSLRRLDDGFRSAFGADGIIAGSERAERFIFWPTGVRSAGAMRQWGRHATAFVGRRHFDDAHLFERRFRLELGQRGP